jgi:hypothetical protein
MYVVRIQFDGPMMTQAERIARIEAAGWALSGSREHGVPGVAGGARDVTLTFLATDERS